VVLARQFHGSGYIAADANSARRNHGARQAVGAKIASTRHLGRLRNVARRALMREPDKPEVLCCGEADAYWADAFEATSDGQYIAIITDARDDEPLGRRHRDIGTRIVVPKNKIKWNEGNPVGHGLIFLNRADTVFCYLPPLGT